MQYAQTKDQLNGMSQAIKKIREILEHDGEAEQKALLRSVLRGILGYVGDVGRIGNMSRYERIREVIVSFVISVSIFLQRQFICRGRFGVPSLRFVFFDGCCTTIRNNCFFTGR